MSRFTIAITTCLLLAVAFGWYSVRGQEGTGAGSGAPTKQAKAEDAAKSKRGVYLVQYGAAKDLGEALSRHFKGEADVQVVPEASGNGLLISATPAAFDEIMKTLLQLDRRPQTIAVELLIAEVTSKPEAGEKESDEREFSGPIDDVVAKVQALRKKGQLGGLKRIQLSALENQLTTVRVGETKPIVTGTAVGRTGVATSNIMYKDVGTSIRLTPRVGADKLVMLDLSVEDSRVNTPENGVAIGATDKGAPIPAAEFVMASLTGKVNVPSGHAVLAKGVKTDSKSQRSQTLVIVTARLVEPGK